MVTKENTQRIYFKNIDILRFIAAYMIVLLHCFFGWKKFFGYPVILTENTTSQSINKIDGVINNFVFGVDIFFIISGFLITYLLLAENDKNGKVDILKFYIRRAFRIWPLYFFMILVGPLLTFLFFEQSPGYLLHFFFLGNFDIINAGTKSVATDHLWSICIEEHFYLVCPLLIAFIPIKKLPPVLLSMVFVSIVFRAYTSTHAANYGSILYLHTLSRIDVLAIGSLFGYLFYYQKIQFNHPLPVRLIVYAIFIFTFYNVDYNECGTFFSVTIKKYFFVLCAAYWAGNFLFNPDAKFAVSKPNILHSCGKVSYGIYMFNPVLIYLFLKLFEKYSFHNFPVFLILVHISLVLTTLLSYRFFELPFLNLKEKYAVIKRDESDLIVLENPSSETISEPVELEPVLLTVESNESIHRN